MTTLLVRYILDLCKVITIKEIVDYLDLDRKTVKEIHKESLKDRYAHEDIGYPALLAIDEIAVKKRHHYLAVIINWETGPVLSYGKGLRVETVKKFFTSLTEEQSTTIRAAAMYMWSLYIKEVTEYCPNAAIVFDPFHAVSPYGYVIDRVRIDKFRNAFREGNEVIKGSKYLLSKNKDNLRNEEKSRMKALLKLSAAITTAYILKGILKKLWRNSYLHSCETSLRRWCSTSQESGIIELIGYEQVLTLVSCGFIDHRIYAIHISQLEDINTSILHEFDQIPCKKFFARPIL